MFRFLMKMLARHDFDNGNAPRLKNAHYEREYGRLYVEAAIFAELSELKWTPYNEY